MGWQWYQLDHMQITCTSLQTDTIIIKGIYKAQDRLMDTSDNHASNSSLKFFTGRMLFLMPNQQ